MEKTVKKRKAHKNPHGSGTLIKRGSTYHARWYIGGKYISQSLRTPDLETAKAEMQRLSVARAGLQDRQTLRKIAQAMTSTMTDISDSMRMTSLPIGQLFALFRDAPNRPDISAGTLKSYEGQFNTLTIWMSEHYPHITNARDISQTIADEYAKYRAASKSANTHNKDLNLFSQAWRLLSNRYGLEYNPWTEEHIARLKLKPKNRRNLTSEECAKILACATLEEKTMICLSLYASLRMGDVVRLKWSAIDFERRWITHKHRKTGKTVSLPIAAPLLTTLTKWKSLAAPDCDLIFPAQFARLKTGTGNTENISRSMCRLFERAGIKTHSIADDGTEYRSASFHSLRHTFITNLMSAGVDPLLVKEAAGHSVMATTLGYTHIGESTLRAALDAAAKA